MTKYAKKFGEPWPPGYAYEHASAVYTSRCSPWLCRRCVARAIL